MRNRFSIHLLYSPEEAAFYQNAASPYTTARQDNFTSMLSLSNDPCLLSEQMDGLVLSFLINL